MQRLRSLAVGEYSVSVAPTDDDGETIELAGNVALTVRDGAGDEVFEATVTAEEGKATASIPHSALPHLDAYELTWESQVEGSAVQWIETLEIVGGYHFEIADLRSLDRGFTVEKFTSEALRTARTAAENLIEGEHAAHVAFVPRGARATVDGSGTVALEVPNLEVREVISVAVDGEQWSDEEVQTLVVDDCLLRLSTDSPLTRWPVGAKNIVVHYTHGRSVPPPPISRAALLLVRDHAVPSDLPGRATAASIGEQMFRMTVAGRDGTTGLPEVDAAIKQFGRRRIRAGTT